MKKRIFSAFLSALILSLTVVAVFAEENEQKLKFNRIIYSDDGYSFRLEDPVDDTCNESDRDIEVYTPVLGSVSLPSAYDSRNYGYVTSVKNQGTTGNCWAFATISALESDAIMKGWETRDTVDFSEAHLVWSTFTPSGISTDVNRDECALYTSANMYMYGGNINYAMTTLAKGCGITDEADFPYYPYNPSAMGNYSQSDYYINNGYVVGNVLELESRDAVKEWIMNHGSVFTGLYASGQFNTLSVDGKSYCTYNYTEHMDSNHAVTIVGWDNNLPKEYFINQPDENGAWLVKNSWGTSWGVDGYFWLSYEDVTINGYHGLETEKADFDYVHTYNGTTFASAASSSAKVFFSNVFNISSPRKIKEIGFVSYNNDAEINLSIRKLNSSTDKPSSGTRIYSDTFTIGNRGFHRHKLSNPLNAEPGFYSVTVRVTAPTAYFVFERIGVENFVYTASKNQSYYSTNGTIWTDFSSYGNVFVDLYTSCNHSMETVRNEPTCLEGGNTYDLCSRCGYTTGNVVLPALGHDMITETISATCLGEGSQIFRCSRCDYVQSSSVIPVSGHTLVTDTVPATCYAPGYTSSRCGVCGTDFGTAVLPQLEHSYTVHSVNPPTCTLAGYDRLVCEFCGDVFSETELPAKGHTSFEVNTFPTCTEDGHTVTKCSDCGMILSDFVVPATGHTLVEESIEPTCAQSGYNYTYCSVCNRYFVNETLPALGHSYDSFDRYDDFYEITYVYHCSRCGEDTISVTDKTKSNVVTLADLLKLIFTRIFSPFRKLSR